MTCSQIKRFFLWFNVKTINPQLFVVFREYLNETPRNPTIMIKHSFMFISLLIAYFTVSSQSTDNIKPKIIPEIKSSNGWISFSGNGSDLFEFNGLPNGYTNNFGGATGSESIATWATTEIDHVNRIRKVANIYKTTLDFADNSSLLGSGIRCIKE